MPSIKASPPSSKKLPATSSMARYTTYTQQLLSLYSPDSSQFHHILYTFKQNPFYLRKFFGVRLASRKRTKKMKDHYKVSMSTSRPKSQAKRLLGNVFKTIRWFVLNTPVPDSGSCTSMLKGAVKKSWSSAVYRLPPRPRSYPTRSMFLGHFTPNT